VLAVFCLAWLQAAVAPCVMAHVPDAAPLAAAAQAHHGPAAHDTHASHGQHEAPAQDGSPSPCMYCPPAGHTAGTCDGHDCAFPHDPQVDARGAGALFAALPTSFVVPSPAALLVADRAEPGAPDVVPRIRLSVSYCRFIE
jgi:hypothetical protein